MAARARVRFAAWLVASVVLPCWVPARAEPTPVPSPPPTLASGLDLPAWLVAHPKIAAALVWEDPSGQVAAYDRWPGELRSRLAALVADIGAGKGPELPEAPRLANPSDPAKPAQPLNPELARWPADVARESYLAYAAQSLAVEIGKWVGWSIESDDPAVLARLLDSRSLWRADPATGTYRIPYSFGATTPGDPYRSFQFLRANGLIAPGSRQTIERVVGWMGRNVVHFQGDWNAANVYATWQYYGWPPLDRVLAGTTYSRDPAQGVRRRVGACFGAVGVLELLLRTVNIPVELLHTCPGHGVPHFVREDLFLSHGDDPYSSMLIATPPIPPAALLIDRARYQEWLGSDEVSITQCKNIGRQVRELAMEYLSDELLVARCADRAAATDSAASRVYDLFKFDYPLATLEQRGLWKRLDDKIAARGGCEQVRPPR